MKKVLCIALLLGCPSLGAMDKVKNGIFAAIDSKECEKVDILLSDGTQVEQCNEQKETPLCYVIKKYVVCAGKVLQACEEESKVLHRDLKLWYGIIQLLFQKGAQVEVRDAYNRTPLCYAVMMYLQIAAQSSSHPFYASCKKELLDLISVLLDKGATVEHPDGQDNTLLYYVLERMNVDLAVLLLNRGADCNACCHNGVTPFYRLISTFLEYVDRMLKAEEEQGHDLHYNLERLYVIATLIPEHDATIDQEDSTKKTPLYHAVKKYLHLCKQPPLNTFYTKVKKTLYDLIELLALNGAKVDVKDGEGNTLLYCALVEKAVRLAVLLKKHGANLHEECSDDESSPLEYLMKHGLIDLISLMAGSMTLKQYLEKHKESAESMPVNRKSPRRGSLVHPLRRVGPGGSPMLSRKVGGLRGSEKRRFSSPSVFISANARTELPSRESSEVSHEGSNASGVSESDSSIIDAVRGKVKKVRKGVRKGWNTMKARRSRSQREIAWQEDEEDATDSERSEDIGNQGDPSADWRSSNVLQELARILSDDGTGDTSKGSINQPGNSSTSTPRTQDESLEVEGSLDSSISELRELAGIPAEGMDDIGEGLTTSQGISSEIKRNQSKKLFEASIRGDLNAVIRAHGGAADIQARNEQGRTALQVASQATQPEIVSYLLQNGARVREVDNEGKSPLLIAVEAILYGGSFEHDDKQRETVCLLIQHLFTTYDTDQEEESSSLGSASAEQTELPEVREVYNLVTSTTSYICSHDCYKCLLALVRTYIPKKSREPHENSSTQ